MNSKEVDSGRGGDAASLPWNILIQYISVVLSYKIIFADDFIAYMPELNIFYCYTVYCNFIRKCFEKSYCKEMNQDLALFEQWIGLF